MAKKLTNAKFETLQLHAGYEDNYMGNYMMLTNHTSQSPDQGTNALGVPIHPTSVLTISIVQNI
jgi:hypothetical protein